MGHVWLARDERNGLDVALKMVGREGRVAERADREARAAAALRHPRCQRIYALARDSNHVYIAYEYIPGRTLRQAMAARELDDASAVEAAAQMLEALAHAHRKGIVHRDVKPSNVLLAESDKVDVRLLDFGLAQMEEFDTLTQVGDVPGTLTYVSPERLDGRQATEAADVWAVGVVLWEALAGKHPFRSEQRRGNEQAHPRRRAAARDRPARPASPAPERGRPGTRPGSRAAPARLPARGRAPRGAPQAHGEGEADSRCPVAGARDRDRQEPRLPALAAAAWTGWVTSTLSFYPAGWPVGLTAVAAAVGLAFPRAGFPFALAVTFFPLANISLGLALVFALLAAGWTALTWNDPRGNLALVAGPVLGPLAALALLPLVAQLARGPVRRACQAAAGALLAVLVAGLRGEHLPFDGTPAPLGLGITGSEQPAAVVAALWRPLDAHPVVVGQALVLAAVAVALPYVRGRGPWFAAAGGVVLLAATGLGAPAQPSCRLQRPPGRPPGSSWSQARSGRRPSPRRRAPRSGPTSKRDSRLRRREIVPTFSPEGL